MARILFVLPTLAHCGATRQAALLAAGLPRAQFDLRVCSLSADGPAAEALQTLGVPVEPLGPARLFNLAALWRLRRLVRDHRPDVIHVWGPSSLRAVVLAGAGNSRLLASQPLPIRERPARPGRLERWLLRRVDRFLARGPSEAETWQRLGLPLDRIHVIPSTAGVLPKSTIPPPQYPSRNRYLACVGPLEPHKGIRDAVWAYDILRVVYAELRLVVLGTGPERPRLEGFAHAIGAGPYVHFAGAAADLRGWLAGAEAVWVPSRAEAGYQSTLEAMALGRPVVASRLPGLREIVGDGETGFLAAPGDKVKLARRTRELLDDPALARRLGDAGRRRAETCFAAEDFIRRMASLYLTPLLAA